MNQQLANLSADLRRISYWIYQGRLELAESFLERDKKICCDLNHSFGLSKVIAELNKISSLKEERLKTAERALTLSRIIFYKAKTS